jgi:MFS family permease
MAAASPNPAFVTLGRAFGITLVQASYQLVVYLVFSGVGPLFVVPFASSTGRRPIVVASSLLAAVTNIIAGYCSTWTGIVVTRAVNGFAVGATVALGPAVICDMYFLHERALYLGIFALLLNNGPHIAPLIGGYVTGSLGWRHCFAIPVGDFFHFLFNCFAN